MKSGSIHSGTWAKFYRNVCSDASIVVACLLNAYHIVQHPKKLEGSLIFLQKFLLGIGNETKTPQKVLQSKRAAI